MEQQMHAQEQPAGEKLSLPGPHETGRTRPSDQEEWRAEFPYPWSEDQERCLIPSPYAEPIGLS